MVKTPGTAGAWILESKPTIWFTEVRRLFQKNAICWFEGLAISSWHRAMASTIEHRDPHKGMPQKAPSAQQSAHPRITQRNGAKLWAGWSTCQAQFLTNDGPIARHTEYCGRNFSELWSA
jgi:hypothetical protein